jgi:hypothetical protein
MPDVCVCIVQLRIRITRQEYGPGFTLPASQGCSDVTLHIE